MQSDRGQRKSLKAVIESIRDYIMTCPLLRDGTLNVDYLPERVSYSIDSMPGDPWYKKYVDGGGVRQLYFAITSKEAYGEDVLSNISNSGFYQALEEWLYENSLKDNLPVLDGYKAVRIETTATAYLMYADVGLGNYQIQCRLLYE